MFEDGDILDQTEEDNPILQQMQLADKLCLPYASVDNTPAAKSQQLYHAIISDEEEQIEQQRLKHESPSRSWGQSKPKSKKRNSQQVAGSYR